MRSISKLAHFMKHVVNPIALLFVVTRFAACSFNTPIADGSMNPSCRDHIPTETYVPLPVNHPCFIYGLPSLGVNNIYFVEGYWLVSTDYGLALSRDEGSTFRSFSTFDGLSSMIVNGAIEHHDRVFVATNRGLSISGTDLTHFSTAVNVRINDLATSDSGRIMAGGSSALYHSMDSGESFQSLNTPSINRVISHNDSIYLGTNGGLLIGSESNFTFATRTTSNGLGSNFVNDIAIDENVVFAGTSNGLSISYNGGSTFVNRTSLHGLSPGSVLSVIKVDSKLYVATSGGLAVSIDNGLSFQTLSSQGLLGSPRKIKCHSGALYVATSDGIGISYDHGLSFRMIQSSMGMRSMSFNDVVFISRENDLPVAALASNAEGIVLSHDGGASFSKRGMNSGLGSEQVNDLELSDSVLYAATSNGFSMSSNAGETYSTRSGVSLGLPSSNFTKVAVDGNRVFLGTTNGLGVSQDFGSTFILRTTQNGLGHNRIRSIVVKGGRIFVGTNYGVSHSEDGGMTFTTNTAFPGLFVRAVAIDGNTVVVGTESGIAISSDGGQSFPISKRVEDGLVSNDVLSLRFGLHGRLFVGTREGLSVTDPPYTDFQSVTEVDGLADRTITGMAFDVLGNMMFASSWGLTGFFKNK